VERALSHTCSSQRGNGGPPGRYVGPPVVSSARLGSGGMELRIRELSLSGLRGRSCPKVLGPREPQRAWEACGRAGAWR